MKPKFLVPLMLVVFLAGSAIAMGQDRNQKKIERLQRKIEKQSKKLQELTGDQYHAFAEIAPPMNAEEIEKIREEAMAQAEEAREQVRESVEQQREALQEQREAMRDQKKELENQMIVIRKKNTSKMGQMKALKLDKLRDLEESEGAEVKVWNDSNGKKYSYSFKTPKWESKEGGALVFGDTGDVKIDIPEIKGGVYNFFSDNQDNLSINKDLTDESSTADFNYEVKEGAGGMSLNVTGAIDAGKVKITIKRPDGEVYNEYTLSPLANVNWKQTIKFEGQKESEYLGKWMVTVAAEKAKGKYNVQINGR
ncbi:MAG: hypothetical protein NTV01_09495 [Bacteroidia bacterium]|nr:hypothetical protein [Bacteroidia bacterium]